jgi:hypothetical protein
MIWWFLILAAGAGAVVWAAISAYLRVRRHLNGASASKKEDQGPDAG